MASKAASRVKKVDWPKMMQQIHKMELAKLNKFKSSVDSTATKAASLPESLPKIDWAHYKKHASDPKIVEEIEKKYATVKVEAPKAPASRLQDLQIAREQDEARIKKFRVLAQSYVDSAEEVKQKFKDMIPWPQMTREEYALTFPEWDICSIDNPSIAPHWGRTAGLTREEAMAFEQPDPLPYSTKSAWREWEKQKKKYFPEFS